MLVWSTTSLVQVGLVKPVRQAKATRDAAESDGEARGFESSAEFPYIEDSSHALLFSPSVGALKKINPISKGAPGLESRTPGRGGSPTEGQEKINLEPPKIRGVGHQIVKFDTFSSVKIQF